MTNKHTIAVLVTCFNRRQKTLDCLRSLYAQQDLQPFQLKIFLTDDGSSDGTAEAVRQHFPEVHVLIGDGNLFWAGGMRFTWRCALQSGADYYLLINDDTHLYPHAIATLLQHRHQSKNVSIAIGSTVDVDSGKTSYGGNRLTSNTKWKSKRIEATGLWQPCDFANANILFVPAAVVSAIGILSESFTHGLADFDYTLKAKKAGIELWVAPGFLGACKDDHGQNWKSNNVQLKQRMEYLMSPTGLAYKEYLLYIRRHFPYSYPAEFLKLWLKTLFPFLWDVFKQKENISNHYKTIQNA